ncbi:MAG: acyltransferase [Paludibacter sp.]
MYSQKNRITYIDGFRGFAILLVLFFHAFTKWTTLVPYGGQFSGIQLFNKGWLGVNLFFLISGFVILMSLEKCLSFRQFIIKRWLRLFPAMLVVTTLIYFSAILLPERPKGIPSLRDCLPGLLFVENSWVGFILPGKQGVLEGSFWSLFVEMKYYFIFGLLYFVAGKRNALRIITILFIAAVIGLLIVPFSDSKLLYVLNLVMEQLSFIHLGWFATGSLIYEYSRDLSKKTLIQAQIVGLLSVFSMGIFCNYSSSVIMAAFIILYAFICVQVWDKLKPLLTSRVLVYVGFVSYPLYLIHENAMIALVIKLAKNAPFIPGILLPVLPLALLLIISHLIATYAEPFLNKNLKRIMKQ